MDKIITEIFSLSDECVQLCLELRVEVEAERIALTQLKTDELLEHSSRKEITLNALVAKRKIFREIIQKSFGIPDSENLDQQLPEPYRSQWLAKRGQWLEVWASTHRACEIEALFLAHSQRNLNLLTNNLKRLFGEPGLYSAKGTKVDKPSQGRVVEVSY